MGFDREDTQDVLLILRLVTEGVGVASEIAKLAQRVLDGDAITDEEIQQARTQVRQAVSEFDQVVADRKEHQEGSD